MLTMNRNQIPLHLLKFFSPRNVYKPKDDAMIPHRVYAALMADGWYGRMDNVWSKPNPMPESVTDRPTKAHEYLFMLSKRDRYFYDATAISEPITMSSIDRLSQTTLPTQKGSDRVPGKTNGPMKAVGSLETGHRNRRSVWTVSTQPYSGAHFAVFPAKLIEPCILAGTSEHGACAECGAPWVRVVERETNWQQRKSAGAWKGNIGISSTYQNSVHGHGMSHDLGGSPIRSMNWQPSCTCDAARVPCVVLDPFIGSGTTAVVSKRLGRRSIGIDLSETYLRELAIPRLYQQALPMEAR